ncbi:MAG: hypothetical protein NTY41_00335 [Proteobacteria bacterium]|nr:hypothetical protein [Pseudomonadota bacterium]
MKPFAILMGCLLLVLSNAACAQAAGRGSPSCGEWVAHREKSDTLALGNAYWLQGFLSGLAMGSGKDFLVGTENSAINGWMDKYCQDHPLKDLASGANALAAELLKNKRTAK